MKLIALLTLTLLVSCGRTEKFDLVPGPKGDKGDNGHSLVSELITNPQVCINGGSRLDIYIDLNDNLSADSDDQFQSSLISCNGADGEAGSDGLQGLQGEVGPQGEQGEPGPAGPQGEQGEQGIQGESGLPGSSCTLTSLGSNKYRLTCGEESIVVNANQGNHDD